MFIFLCAVMFDVGASTALPSSADHLPPAALVRFGTTRFGHRDPITWVGFANGRTVLTTSNHDGLRFWDGATGKESAHYESWSPRRTFALSADRKKLALRHYRAEAISILDVATRKEIRRLTFDELFGPEGERFHFHFALSPDGRFLAIWDYLEPDVFVQEEVKKRRRFSLDVWDLEIGRRIRTWNTGDLYEVEFTPDGKTLVAQEWGRENRLRSWEIGSGKELRSAELSHALARLIFLPDGKTILGLGVARDKVHQFDAVTGKAIRAVADKKGPIATFTLSPDGKNLALAEGGKLIVQELDTGKIVLQIPLPVDPARVFARHFPNFISELAAFSADGKLLAVANGRRLELWNLATGSQFNPEERIEGPVVAIQTHGQHLLARDLGMNLTLWDLRTGHLVRRFLVEPSRDSSRKQPFAIARDNLDSCRSFQAISPDGQLVAAVWLDGPIQLFDLRSGKRLHGLQGSDKADCLTFSPNGKLLAGPMPDGRIGLWETGSGKLVQQLTPREPGMQDSLPGYLALHFSPDARTLTASTWSHESCDILTWELATGKLRSVVNARNRSSRFSLPEGLRERDRLENLTVSFSTAPDGKHVVVAGPRSIRLLDLASRKEVRRFGGPDIAGQSAVFSPDGKYLAAGLENGGIRFWDAATGTVVRDVPAHSATVTSLAFADGGKMVSGSLDGTAIAWEFDRLLTMAARKKNELPTAELEALWACLGESDAEPASQAMQVLTSQRNVTVAFLKTRLRPVPIVSPERLTQLVGDLQSNQFAVRQRATAELENLRGQARAALETALKDAQTIETRRRIEALLQKLAPPATAPDLLRTIRGVEVLERIGTLESRRLLEALAAGGPGDRLTEDARDALDRLANRP